MTQWLQFPQNQSHLAAPLPEFHPHAGGPFGAEHSDQSGPPVAGSSIYPQPAEGVCSFIIFVTLSSFFSLVDAAKSVFFVDVLMFCCLFYDVFISCSTSPGSIPVSAFHHLLFLLLF